MKTKLLLVFVCLNIALSSCEKINIYDNNILGGFETNETIPSVNEFINGTESDGYHLLEGVIAQLQETSVAQPQETSAKEANEPAAAGGESL